MRAALGLTTERSAVYGDAQVRLPEAFGFGANRFLVAYRDDAFAVVARMAARLAHEVVGV